jgi:hypothetical protein
MGGRKQTEKGLVCYDVGYGEQRMIIVEVLLTCSKVFCPKISLYVAKRGLCKYLLAQLNS